MHVFIDRTISFVWVPWARPALCVVFAEVLLGDNFPGKFTQSHLSNHLYGDRSFLPLHRWVKPGFSVAWGRVRQHVQVHPLDKMLVCRRDLPRVWNPDPPSLRADTLTTTLLHGLTYTYIKTNNKADHRLYRPQIPTVWLHNSLKKQSLGRKYLKRAVQHQSRMSLREANGTHKALLWFSDSYWPNKTGRCREQHPPQWIDTCFNATSVCNKILIIKAYFIHCNKTVFFTKNSMAKKYKSVLNKSWCSTIHHMSQHQDLELVLFNSPRKEIIAMPMTQQV